VTRRRRNAEVAFWQSSLGGGLVTHGMDLDLDGGVDISRRNRFDLAFQTSLTRRDHVSASFFAFEHEGTLAGRVTYDARLYTPGAAVEQRERQFDLGGSRTLHHGARGWVDMLYGAKWLQVDFDMTQTVPAGRQTAFWNQHYTVPYLGVAGRSRLGSWSWVTGGWKFSSLGSGGDSVRTSDLDLGVLVGVRPDRESHQVDWYGRLGFRDFRFHGDDGNSESRVEFRGPTFGVTGEF